MATGLQSMVSVRGQVKHIAIVIVRGLLCIYSRPWTATLAGDIIMAVDGAVNYYQVNSTSMTERH